MKLRLSHLRALIREAIETAVAERPWSVKFQFSMQGGDASDSEGVGPDGVVMSLSTESAEVNVIADSYWNPKAGDESGNSLKVEVNGEVVASSYVPHRFDDGEQHAIIVTNNPGTNELSVLHACPTDAPPVAVLTFENPFTDEEEIQFDCAPVMDKGAEFTECEVAEVVGL